MYHQPNVTHNFPLLDHNILRGTIVIQSGPFFSPMVLTRHQKQQKAEGRYQDLWSEVMEDQPFILEDHQEITNKILDFYNEFIKIVSDGEWKLNKMNQIAEMLSKVNKDFRFLEHQKKMEFKERMKDPVHRARFKQSAKRACRVEQSVPDYETEFWKDWGRANAGQHLILEGRALDRKRDETLTFHDDGAVTFKLTQK